jgi:hypothetical protein
MNIPLTKSQQKIRFLLFLILVVNMFSYYIIIFLKLSKNTNLFLGIYLAISISIMIIAILNSVINWKSFCFYLLIAVALISIAFFR